MTRSGRRAARMLVASALALAVALPALTAAPAALAADAPAADASVGVATRPAGADGRPDGRARLNYSADPGQSVTDQVLVGNTGTERQDFTVFATDAFNSADGEFSLLATDEQPVSVGAWVTFEDAQSRIQFSLEPEQVRLVTFTVAVPADATPGDHVGGLVASVVEDGQQVSLDRRVATAVFARVSGELQPRLSLSGIEAAYEGDWWNPFGGSVRVLYTVDNPGNVALAANLAVGVNTWFGMPATAAQGGSIPVLLPGNSATYEFVATGVGQWGFLDPWAKVSPFVESSDTSLTMPVAPVTRDTVVTAIPWSVLILAALVAAGVLLNRWRRRRDAQRAQEWVEYTEQQARESARSLAEAGSPTAS
jgi:hypothetical protein